MSSLAEIRDIARSVFDDAVPGFVEDVLSEEILDSSGDPAIEVIAITRPGSVADDGDSLARNDARARLQRRLTEVGEERFAYVRFLQADELAAPESSDES